jgi:polyisoprenoid-binding protein YceI
MPLTFGPANATLTVRTKRTGAAARAGHDLLIEVTSWEAAVDPQEGSVTLTADPRSLRVLEGTGGMQALGAEDKAGIEKTIDDEVLKGRPIEFWASEVDLGADGSGSVRGELQLAGERGPIGFQLTAQEGRLTATAAVRQSDWGMKPYSALFGTLKVADEVEVAIDTGPRGDQSR